MKLKRFFSIFLFIVLILSLTGCKIRENQQNNFKIVTTCYPMYVLALNLTDGTNTNVTNLETTGDGCGHDVELTTSDMKNIENSDLVILNGAGLESYTENLYKMRKDGAKFEIIDASENLELIKSNSTVSQSNPHVWLSPINYTFQIDYVSEKLQKFDSKNADMYRHNAYYYKEKILKLNKDFTQDLRQKASSLRVVTVHDAFAYFNNEFGISTVKVVEMGSHDSANPIEIKETIEYMKAFNVKNIFVDAHYAENSVVQMLSKESGAKLAIFDTNICGDGDKDSYLEAMRRNFDTLKEILEND